MHEVRVESLEKLEATAGELRLSANSGTLRLVFPREVWERILDEAPKAAEPKEDELDELEDLRKELEAHARRNAFDEVLERAPCGDSGVEYDLVLRPGGLYAMTTGYHFAPVVGAELVVHIGSSLSGDKLVEQAYVIGAVASEAALDAGDENLKVLSVRGRRCSTSRFEMAPELWQVLSGGLGWRNVETYVNERG